jgi:hypothetical protein
MESRYGMGDLPADEIRSTIHLSKELTTRFDEACKKRYGKDWKKKTGYRDALEMFVKETLGDKVTEVQPEVQPETPTLSTQIATTPNMSIEDKEIIAQKLAEERKRQRLLSNPPPPFSNKVAIESDSDIISFLNNVPRDRKIRITRVEIE